MKKIYSTDSTSTVNQMEKNVSKNTCQKGPRMEVLNALRQFARAYAPIADTGLPGMVLN